MSLACTQSPHKYSALPSSQLIRLLHLLPAREHEPLTCSLTFANINARGFSYEAISYAWGAPVKESSIICDGLCIKITRSLHEALQRFRFGDRPRVLWADAICIDQDNVEERSAQVRLMSQIYRNASNVLIWLGHADELEVHKTFAAICKYNRMTSQSNEFQYMWWDTLLPAKDDDLPEYQSDEEFIGALARLCSCAWFRRGWVAQEVVLAQSAHIHWSHGTIRFADIGFVLYTFWTKHKSARTQLFHGHSLYRIYIAHNTPQDAAGLSFFHLMSLTQEFGFSDLRDRVYGLLGMATKDMASQAGGTLIEPDYSATVAECYRRLTEALVVQRNDLRPLSRVWHHKNSAEHDDQDESKAWPSWVPDYTEWNLNCLRQNVHTSDFTTGQQCAWRTDRGI